MNAFTPNYENIESTACNIRPKRLPLYEHIISDHKMEEILDTTFAGNMSGISLIFPKNTRDLQSDPVIQFLIMFLQRDI
jgi:hypothetical protein